MKDKETFSDSLRRALEEEGFAKEAREEIVEDYREMISEASLSKEEESAFIGELGSPREIAKKLAREMPKQTKDDHKLVALSPFLALIAFFLIGTISNVWHPTWLVFFITPISAIWTETRGLDRLKGLSVFVLIAGYVLLATYTGDWHPLWALLVLMVALNLYERGGRIRKAGALYTVAAVGGFLTLDYLLGIQFMHVLLFAPTLVLAVESGVFGVRFDIEGRSTTRQEKVVFSGLVVLMAAVYLLLGFMWALWHPGWLVFLLVPLFALLYVQFILGEKLPLVAYSPFIATALFVIVGHAFDAYNLSWLFFLAIPVLGILTDKDDEEKEYS